MIKEIKYETNNIEDVVLDLADEIKNGWKIHSFGWPNMFISVCGQSEMNIEVTLMRR